MALVDGDGDGGTTNYKLQFRNDGGPERKSSSRRTCSATGEWHHFVVQYDLTGAEPCTVTLWIDGGPNWPAGSKEVLTGFGNQSNQGRHLYQPGGSHGSSVQGDGRLTTWMNWRSGITC